jgi:hypothetical protein
MGATIPTPVAASDAAAASPGAALAGAKVVSELDVITAAMERVADLVGDAGGWPGDLRAAVLGRLDRAVDGLVTVRAAVLVAERDAGTWKGSGDPSPQAWRARTARTGRRAAAAEVRQAEQLGAVPSVAAAVTAGRIGLQHAVAIGKLAATGTSTQQDAVRSPATVEQLLSLAEHEDADTFAGSVTRWAATIDPAGAQRDHDAQRAGRFLHLSHTPDGTFVKGRLDRMAGHRVARALEALSPRPGADDDRDPGQRCADALDAMAVAILAAGDTKPGAHVPSQVSMILTADTWAAARDHRDRQRRSGCREAATAQPDGDATEPLAYPPATLEDGTPVPARELAAAMCECEITRIVIDADGVPLDVGRSQRLFTGAQRRAVIARDRHCAWPDCAAPARWSQIHHILWWERDTGPTSVDNAVLLCSYHHHEVHRRDLTITRIGVRAIDVPCPGARSPGSETPPGSYAPMGYEFRDRAGRVVRGRETVGAPGPEAAVGARRGSNERGGAPEVGTWLGPNEPGGAPAGIAPPTLRPARESVPESRTEPDGPGTAARHVAEGRPDELELTWVTDPFTGMRVPALFADG